MRAAHCLRALALATALASGAALGSTTVNHQFTPATINPGDVSQYRITIANSSLVPLTAAAVTEILPAPVTIASPVTITNTCGFTVSAAAPGTSTVFLTAGTIPAGTGAVDGLCFFQIDVTATTSGNHVATIPANTPPDATTSGYTAMENGVPVFNTTPASATLSVNALSNPTGSKVFAPSPAIAGDPVTLTITLTNPNAGSTIPLTSFTDALPSGMVVASPPGASTSCSGTGAVNGALSPAPAPNDGAVTLAGGTIGRSGTCTITVSVRVPAIAGTSQAFNNVLGAGAIGNTRGLTSPAFSRSLTVNTPIGVTKSFGTPNIPSGQPSLMTLRISNASTSNALDITSFADNLTGTTLKILSTASVPVAAPANPAVLCTGTGAVNGTLTAPPDLLDQTITLAGARAGPGGNCTITAYLTSTVDGAHVNTVPANAVLNPAGHASPGPVTATLTANAQLTVGKTVTVANVAPGQWTQFTVTINNFSGGAVTGVTFRDVLPANGANQMTLFDAGSGFFTAPAPGCSGGAFTGTDAAGTSTGLPPTAADAGLLWTGGTIIAGVGASPGVCTISIWARLPATAPTGLTFTNLIPIGSVTGTGPAGGVGNINAGSVNVVSIASGAVTKAFAPVAIAQGQLSTLTITLLNRTVTPLTGVSLTDNLPAGVMLAAVPAATNTCGGSLQAFPNATVVALTGGTVPARPAASQQATCVMTVRVTGTVVGPKVNTINPGDFANNELVTIPASVSATLTINTGLTGTKAFTPASVSSGGVSRVRITVNNTSSGALTNVSVDDNTFSAGLTVANPANPATNCGGSPTMVVNPGIARAQLLGATLAAGGSCDFSFDVVTSGAGPWSDTVPIGKITSAEGASNTAGVTANLTVTAAQININKSFNPVVVTGGQPSVLQIDVINPSASVITGVGFTDTFPVGIVVYSVPAAGTDCAGGIVSALPGGGSVRLAGATLAAFQTCRVFVTTTSTRFLNLTNTIPAGAVESDQGYTNPTGTSATLSTLQGLNVLKAFSPAYVIPAQVSTLTMSLVSSFDPSAPTPLTLHGVTFTDTLPNGVFVAATPNAATDCAGTGTGGLAVVSTSNGGSNGLVTVTQGTIAPGTSCSITVDVVANVLGAYNNTIPANSVTTDEGIPNQSPASATLFVVSRPTVAKAFTNPTRNPGQTTVLTVTITNGATIPITGVSLVDTLPAGVAIASTPATGGTCATVGGGVVAAVAGGGTLSLTGATIAAGSSCTFFATVVSNTPGVYVNDIPAAGIVTNEGLTNTGSAQATLTVNGPPTVAKAFNPVSIAAGATSTLTLTLGNPNAGAITLSALFTDALPGNVFVAAVPNVVKTCPGAVTAAAGATSLTYANGATIPAGGCTISVDVTSATPGVYNNLIAAGQLSTSAGVNQQPATASLGVASLVPPTMSKSFAPSTIFVGGTSALTIVLGNANGSALTLTLDLDDNLPPGVTVAAVPNIRGTCTGAVTAAASLVRYAAGSTIPAGGCTVIVDVTSATPGSYTNTLAASALVTDGGSPTQPAPAGLVVVALTPPTVVKAFSPGTINPGGTSTLTITLGNANASALTLSNPFTDGLPGSVSVAASPNASTTCTGGVVLTAASSVTLTGGSIQPGGCVVVVDVTSSTPGGPYTNTIPANALQTSGGNNAAPATDRLFVNPFQPPSVAKSFVPAVIGAGGVSRFTLTISNGNLSAATLTANLVDTFPGPGLVIATPANLLLGAGCTAASVVANAGATSVTYLSGGALPANGGCSIQVDVTSSTVRSYVNPIAIGAVQTTVGNNVVAASATLQVLALPTIAKAFAPVSIPLGSSSSLTLTLGNTNAVALTLASDFVDTLPPNLVLGTPATVTGTCAAANVVAAAGGPSVTFLSGASIPAGGCTITVPVTTALAGGYDNVIAAGALVTAIGANPSGASAHLDVLSADLSTTKTDGVATAVPGTTTTYTILVTNAGPSAVVNAPVTDTLPAAVASATWTCAASGGSSCGAAGGAGNIASTVSLLSGGTATYTLVAMISPSATGSLVNTATVSVPAGVTDPTPANNTATDTDTLTPQADLSVVKTGPPTLVPGQNAVYSLTVTNAGPSTAVTVSLSDTLPAGTTFVSLASPGGWSCSTPAVGATGTVSCSIASLSPSASGVFTLTVAVDPAVLTGTAIANTATVSSPTPDPDPLNNTSTTTGTAAASADLSISKTGPATAVPGGPNVVFTTVVTNNGPSDAQTVAVTDPTPANLTFLSNAGACTGAFPCNLATVPAGATRTITSTYAIPSGYPAPAPIVNTATVSSPTPDTTPGDNVSTATVLVPNGVADVAVTKTVSNPAPAVGANVTFTITVSDLGPSDASGVAITDVLPSGLAFVSATPSQGSYTAATGVWTVGNVPNGASATLALVATVTQAGAIVNTATKTAGDQTDPNPSNNSGTAVVNGAPLAADIQVSKLVDVPTPAVGTDVIFTVTALNAGPSGATGVAVTDVLPLGLTFVSATPSAGTSFGAGVWTIGSLPNGGSATLALRANVTAAGTYVNTATKTAQNEPDPNPSNDTGVAGVVAGGGGSPRADLGILKTDSPDAVRAGQDLTYTLVVTNRGPNDATGVTVSDPLPAGVSFVSASPSQGACSGTSTVTCLLGALPAGNSATISIVVTASAAAVPSVTNTATVSGNETDPNPGDNAATAPTTVLPVADVGLLKTVSNPAPLVAQSFTFTVTATNNGPSTANGLVVTDVLPGLLAFVSAAPSQGAYAPATGLWTVGTLANGASATLTLTVTAISPGAFTNTATKTGQTEIDPNPANDSASASGGVGVVADLTIAKTHAPASFVRGSTGTFTLTVSNVGTGSTNAPATVTDALPAGFTPTGASGTGWACTVTAPNVSCSRSDVLAAGNAWPPITLTVGVLQSAAAAVPNAALVSGGGDVTPANNTATDVVPVGESADLSIVKTGPANAIPGANVVYTLVVTNNGPSDAAGVSVADPAPPNLAFVSTSGDCSTPFPCALLTVPVGAARTITATFAVPPGYSAPNPIVNTATVSSATPDPNPANDSSSAFTSVAADLAVTKTIGYPVAAGAPATYDIVVTNNGPSVATNVVLTDPLPFGLTFFSVTTTQGSCTPGATVSCALGTMPVGSTATVRLTVLLPAQLPPARNTASVTADQFDPVPANNTASADLLGGVDIPTLSEWSLILLGVALALAGARFLRR